MVVLVKDGFSRQGFKRFNLDEGLKFFLVFSTGFFFALLSIVPVKAQKTYTDYIKQGNSADSLKDYKAAITAFSEAIKLNKNALEAYYYRGNAEFELQQYKDAADDFSAALR